MNVFALAVISLTSTEVYNKCNNAQYTNVQMLQVGNGNRQQTITIDDTPSPAVSVITISDSDDEAPGKKYVHNKKTIFLFITFY